MLVGATVLATQPDMGNAADNATQETQIQPPEGGQMPPERRMPPEGDMPQNGAMPERGVGMGRGGMGRPMQDGAGENMQMPQQMQNGTQPQSMDEGNMNYSTLVSAAVLLVLGFIFVIFYKRRTF